MWIFILIISVIVKVTSGSISCSQDAFDQCKQPVIFDRIPVSADEFTTLCPELLNYVKCFKEFEETCPEENISFFRKEEYEGMISEFTELCDPESLINAVVIDNLQCLNETFSNTTCVSESGVLIANYKAPIPGVPIEERYLIPSDIFCLRDIMDASCVVKDIAKNCGQLMKDAAVEILRGSFYVQQSCSIGDARDLLEKIDTFPLSQKAKDYVTEVLNKLIETKLTVPFFSVLMKEHSKERRHYIGMKSSDIPSESFNTSIVPKWFQFYLYGNSYIEHRFGLPMFFIDIEKQPRIPFRNGRILYSEDMFPEKDALKFKNEHKNFHMLL
ncbi:uncharacterized protein NPIL_170791 [Nephila pilipes]|uniref:DUF19 domain-containing protein n=1 Tax=Nephila pilipes TaxID=299642 RepID=A0A8X6U8Q7_NEPPI|nr:uncharacterized protein NPIL_170791 [Nephila pilipes]